MEPWNNGTLEAPQGRRGTGCRTLLPPCPARPGGPHPEGRRTNPRPDRQWEQEGQPRASPASPAPGRAIQLRRPPSQRGPDLRSHPALLPLFRALLSQPAPLASPPPAAGRNRLAANYSRFLRLPPSPTNGRTGRLSDPTPSAALRPQAAQRPHLRPHRKRTTPTRKVAPNPRSPM